MDAEVQAQAPDQGQQGPQDPLTEPEGMADAAQAEQPPAGITQRPPQRKSSLVKDPVDVVTKLVALYEINIQDRAEWSEMRIQRTAKYRGWRETKTYPWENASNAHLPIISTDVQRTEDTLHNAVLATRPVMVAKAANKELEGKTDTIDKLIDHQIFVENNGETKIGNLISAFAQDGQFISFNPYIKEKQKFTQTNVLEFPPGGVSWDGWIHARLTEIYKQSTILPGKRAPWEWEIRTTNELTGEAMTKKVQVYQDSDEAEVQLVCHSEQTIFDGPAFIPKELEDIVVPSRCENLQPQTMANPTGAPHVFMVEYPSRDEVLKLIRNGFYDEVTAEQKDELENYETRKGDPLDPQAKKILEDDLVGLKSNTTPEAQPEPMTRLMFFGRADLDGDGLEEEVVYWMLKEPKILLRARYLSEVFPTIPLRRPFAMAKYIPVNGQFYAIGLIELMESGYDIIKKTFDQMIDNGDLTNTPWGFYRPMSGIRPEVMRMGPGDLYPTSNPKDDVYYPQLPQGMAAFGSNIIGLVSQVLDQATLVGQLQLGGVPHGKSAALRTTSNMQALLQQGDARPERVLRRFFTGLAEIWAQFHELNQVFLPKNKKFRISSAVSKEKDPYIEIHDRSQIQGRVGFEFGASILNTNKALSTAALQDMLGMLINPLLFQMGIVTANNVFNLLQDSIKAKGQDATKYITAPTNDPFATGEKITAEDAIMTIMSGYFPFGSPLEPIEEHLGKIQEFVKDAGKIDTLTTAQVEMLAQYVAQVIQKMQQQQQQQQLMANAAAMQQQVGGQQGGKPGPPGQGAPPNMGPGGNPQVQGGEQLPGPGNPGPSGGQ